MAENVNTRSKKPSPYDFETFEAYREAFGAKTWDEETEMLSCWEAVRKLVDRNERQNSKT